MGISTQDEFFDFKMVFNLISRRLRGIFGENVQFQKNSAKFKHLAAVLS